MRLIRGPYLITVFFLVAGVVSRPLEAPAQMATTMVNVTNPCIAMTMGYFYPDLMTPTSIVLVIKTLTGAKVCTNGMMTNAFCNPAGMGTVGMLTASASGGAAMQLTMMPNICTWGCGACRIITTSGATNGLPVELLDFKVK